MKTRNGFTLVEVLIVVVILVILACIVVPQIQEGVAQNRYSEVIEYLRSNYCVKMEYSYRDEKICLIKEDDLKKFLELSEQYFLSLEDDLKRGEIADLGTWTFDRENPPAPGALVLFVEGTRIQDPNE